MEQIVQKVRIVVGESSAHVVFPVAPGLNQPPELGNDDVVCALAARSFPEPVVNRFASVQAQHHVVAFPVGKIDHFVVDVHAVGGQRKAEVLVMRLLKAPGIVRDLLDDRKVHQRLSAEKIHLKIPVAAGIGHKEVHCLPAGVEAHQRPVPVIFPLTGKAVFTAEIAGVGHVQAKGLDLCIPLFEIQGKAGVWVRRKQPVFGLQRLDIVKGVTDLVLVHIGQMPVF